MLVGRLAPLTVLLVADANGNERDADADCRRGHPHERERSGSEPLDEQEDGPHRNATGQQEPADWLCNAPVHALPHPASWWHLSHAFHHCFSQGSNDRELASAFSAVREMRLDLRLLAFRQLAVRVRADGYQRVIRHRELSPSTA